MNHESSTNRDLPSRRLFGALLMAIGGLITLLCGSCTLWWFGAAVWALLRRAFHRGPLSTYDSYGASMDKFVAVCALEVGGLPTALGVTLFIIGSGRYQRTKQGADSANDGG